jgi:hypothetical protein
MDNSEYWKALEAHIGDDNGIALKLSELKHFRHVSLGRTSSFEIHVTINRSDHWIRVGVNLSGPNAKHEYDQLENDVLRINAKFDEWLEENCARLIWERKDGKERSQINVYNCFRDVDLLEDWENQHRWMASGIHKFYKVFRL